MLALVVTGELAKADIAVLVRWPHPRSLLRAAERAVARQVATVSRGNLDVAQRTAAWLPPARESLAVYGEGQPISEASASWLRDQLLQSANTTRRLDPQLAAVYHAQMTRKGAHHQKALTVVAARLAERLWAVMARGTPT